MTCSGRRSYPDIVQIWISPDFWFTNAPGCQKKIWQDCMSSGLEQISAMMQGIWRKSMELWMLRNRNRFPFIIMYVNSLWDTVQYHILRGGLLQIGSKSAESKTQQLILIKWIYCVGQTFSDLHKHFSTCTNQHGISWIFPKIRICLRLSSWRQVKRFLLLRVIYMHLSIVLAGHEA